MKFVKFWLLPILLTLRHCRGYTVDLSKVNSSGNDIWSFLCDFPVISSISEELLVPIYYYSLDKGGESRRPRRLTNAGRMFGYVKIASVEELDESLVVPEVRQAEAAPPKKAKPPTELQKLAKPRRAPVLSVRWKRPRSSAFGSHRNLGYLFKTLLEGEEPRAAEPPPPAAAAGEDQALENLYLVLFSQSQWRLYLASGPYDTVQPSRNRRGFVYYSNVASKLRIPVTRVGDVISFEFESDEPDRYILVLFNPDQRRMTLEGYVRYENPKTGNLPVEMNYHYDILKFWWLVNLAVFFASAAYVLLRVDSPARKVNFMLALNFLLHTTFLLLDMMIVKALSGTGELVRTFWAVSHIFKRLHEIYVLTLMVLLSLGWKVLRSELSHMEFQLISSVCGVSVLMGFVEVLVRGFDVSRYLLHAIACICILVAANFNIVIINTRIADETLSVQAGVAYEHMKTFSNFRLIFFVYMFKPAIFSVLRFVALQPTFDQVIIWDQHLNLFLDLAFDFGVYAFLFLNFLPAREGGLFEQLFPARSAETVVIS